MRPRLVVFDLDGTLVDSRLDLATAVNLTLRDLGRPALPVERIVTFIGNGVDRLLERALGGPERLDEARPRFARHYGLHLLDTTRPCPGIDDLVRRLGRSATVAVATNKPAPLARTIVAGLGWSDVIPFVVGGGDVARLKPASEMADVLLERSGVSRSEAVVVGDMDVDAQFARAAGLLCIGVSWGLAGCEPLQAAGVRWIVDSAAELEALLKKLPARSGD